MSSNWKVSVAVLDAHNEAAVVRCFREVIARPVSEIASALRQSKPIQICALFTKSHDQDEKALLGLISELERLGVPSEIHVSGQVESRQYLLNILQRHREIAYDTQMETDLELGEGSEEAKAWASGRPRRLRRDA